MTSESRLDAILVGAVKEAHGLCIKLPAIWYIGIPDRLVLLPGARIYFVELKSDRGRVAPTQQRWAYLLAKLGFKVFLIKGKIQLKEFIYEFIQRPHPDHPASY